MKLPFDELLKEIQGRILPRLGLDAHQLIGVAVYGSRLTPQARTNSDFDVLVILNLPEAQKKEYHGYVQIHQEFLPIEFRAFSVCSLENELKNGPLPRAHALSNAQFILDSEGKLREMAILARERINGEVENLRKEILSLDIKQVLSLIRIVMTEARNILTDEGLLQNSTAILARFSEFLLDFYVYSEFFLIRSQISEDIKNNSIEDRLATLVFLNSHRSARFLDFRKYSLQKWFVLLQTKINQILRQSLCPRKSEILAVFQAMDQEFQCLSGVSLLISDNRECEAVLESL